MTNDFSGTLVAIFGLIVGVAMVAIILSQKANTQKVIEAFASGTSNVLSAATKPITG